MKQLFIFMAGSAGYGLIEMLWRGHTHWTMLLAGGICFLLLYNIFNIIADKSLFVKCITGSLVITLTELVMGLIINKHFNLDVWDYSDIAFNIAGQICPFYSFLWFILCIPLVGITEKLNIYFEKITKK